MIIDLLQTVINYSKLKPQIYITQIDGYVHESVYIFHLTVPKNVRFNQSILEQKKFAKLKKIDCNGNIRISSVNHLADTLEELKCNGCRGINQIGISKLTKLKVLKCHNNGKIHDINHLANALIELNCSGYCGINQKGLSQLKYLRKLNCSGNTNISDVNYLYNTLVSLSGQPCTCMC